MYIKVVNGKAAPYSVKQLRRDNPQVSFSAEPTDETLAEYGMYPATVANQPSYDSDTHCLVLSDFSQANGQWQAHYNVEPLPKDQAAAAVRSKRNMLLLQSDWTQVADSQVDRAAWATYRQALREITTQNDFPLSVVWPSSP
jgi:hypothetical protein